MPNSARRRTGSSPRPTSAKRTGWRPLSRRAAITPDWCTSSRPWKLALRTRHGTTSNHQTFLRPASGKCLHFHYYFIDPDLVLMSARVPTWRPCNTARGVDQRSGEHTSDRFLPGWRDRWPSYNAIIPSSAEMMAPLMKCESSPASNKSKPSRSSGLPGRLRGSMSISFLPCSLAK